MMVVVVVVVVMAMAIVVTSDVVMTGVTDWRCLCSALVCAVVLH